MSRQMEEDAKTMVLALAEAAGDEAAVLDVLARYGRHWGTDRAVDTSLMALVWTYGHCFTAAPSLDPDHPTHLTIPPNTTKEKTA